MESKIKWKMRVYFLDACNCDWGCPCQFNAKPTHGNCEGVSAFRIIEGNYRDVRLDGIDVVWFGGWPGAIHEGHGKGVYYIDHHADKKQIEALSEIVSGRAGGGPFQVYASTLDELKGPKLAKTIFHPKGIESEVKIESVAEAVLEPIRNPVTGEVHRAIIELPGGFEASRMDQASARKLEVNDEAIKFNYTGTYGSFQETTWQGP